MVVCNDKVAGAPDGMGVRGAEGGAFGLHHPWPLPRAPVDNSAPPPPSPPSPPPAPPAP